MRRSARLLNRATTSSDKSSTGSLANPGSLFQSQHFYGNKSIAQLAQKSSVPISLRHLVEYGTDLNETKILMSGNFVRQELPVRIAHRLRDLQNLPFVVGLNPHLERVYSGYIEAFEALRKIPPIKTLEENDRFCDFLRSLLERHWVTIPRMQTGLLESAPHMPGAAREKFMTRMLRSRISRRVLADQHIAISSQYHDQLEHGPISDAHRFIGIIDTQFSMSECLTSTIQELLPRATGVQTRIHVDGNKDVTFPYIPDHIEYILYELCKNSVLTAKRRGRKEAMSDLSVTIADDGRWIGVRVSDQSGGIPADPAPARHPSHQPPLSSSRSSLLSFSHPRALSLLPQLRSLTRLGGTILEQTDSESDGRLGAAGERKDLGMGLAMSKVYAEYFGGMMELHTMEGGGTDAILRIEKMGTRGEVVT